MNVYTKMRLYQKNKILWDEFEFDFILRSTTDSAKSCLIEKRYQITN